MVRVYRDMSATHTGRVRLQGSGVCAQGTAEDHALCCRACVRVLCLCVRSASAVPCLEYKSERCARQASGFLMAAGVAAAALAGRAILRQARGGQGMGAMFQSLTGAGSVGGAMKVRLCRRGQLHVRAAPVLTSLCRALHRGSTLVP